MKFRFQYPYIKFYWNIAYPLLSILSMLLCPTMREFNSFVEAVCPAKPKILTAKAFIKFATSGIYAL